MPTEILSALKNKIAGNEKEQSDSTSKIDSWTWVRVRDLGRGPVLLTDLLTVFGRMVR